MLIPFINFLVVLDADGDRLIAKYYDKRSKAEQAKCEAALHKKTKNIVAKSDGNSLILIVCRAQICVAAEVVLLENDIIVYKAGTEIKFYVGGPVEEVPVFVISEMIFD